MSETGKVLARFAPGGDDLFAAISALQETLPGLGDPTDPEALIALLRVLYQVGRHDLPLGRLFEGHVDALQIVARYATPKMVGGLRRGCALGVWNADLPGEALRLTNGRLSGAKSFASGAGILSHALVTADTEHGRQLLLLDLARAAPDIDRSWWKVVGMQRSQTHIVRWSDAVIDPAWQVGKPNDYAREPWFSGGALRFVAVQAGGVAALCDRVRNHLVENGRAGDPHQAIRLAALFGCAELAAGAVRRCAVGWFEDPDVVRLPRVAATRMQVADLAEQAIVLAQQSVGVQGLFERHPLAATITDLMVYLRQPGPDAQRIKAGTAVADGLLVPQL